MEMNAPELKRKRGAQPLHGYVHPADHAALREQVKRLADALCDVMAGMADADIARRCPVTAKRAMEIAEIRMQYRVGWRGRKGRALEPIKEA